MSDKLHPQDLRIGNLLQFYIGKEDRQWEERIIDWQDLQWISEYPDTFNKFHKAIPLTEEWLLRFGMSRFSTVGVASLDEDPQNMDEDTIWFEFPIKRSEHCDSFTFLIVKWGGHGEFTFSHHLLRVRLKYVYQLQNLYFTLTGQELINNDKTGNQ